MIKKRNEVNELSKFVENRDMLIDTLKEGKINKIQYIEACYEFLKVENMKPFKINVDSIEKSLYNYQYYNTLAKYTLMKCEECRFRDSTKSRELYEYAQDYYAKKDKETLNLLELINYKNVSAYFLKMNSEVLEGELFEITIDNYDKAVFHSKDKRILNRLKKNGVFDEEAKLSIIDKYVNTKYA
ncbi:DUF6648 family protein [Helicovermis profundi]|uniref:Uncharacterized protein n=1 Tax=Helicovermis profundi TaxID=3065157 RepID=A0AAU9EFC8_9FIRM|nr:hypothetical protein HLPR_04440 [Clostridia bacterium S502]